MKHLLQDNKVASELDIKIRLSPQNIKLDNNNTLFFFVRWKNNPSDNHCIRFCHKTISYTYFMNPTYGKIEHIESQILKQWTQLSLLITKI